MLALSVSHSATAAAVYGLWHYISAVPLSLPFVLYVVRNETDEIEPRGVNESCK